MNKNNNIMCCIYYFRAIHIFHSIGGKTYPTDNAAYVDATFFAIQPVKNYPVVLGRVCHTTKQDKG